MKRYLWVIEAKYHTPHWVPKFSFPSRELARRAMKAGMYPVCRIVKYEPKP